MAGAGRRRRFPDVRIRRRTCSKQRGAKLRSSSSESDGIPDPVVKTVLRNSDPASKLALKVGDDGCDWSPQDIVEVGGDDDDVRYSPMLGCCGCDLVRKHLAVEEGGCEGICALKLGTCDCHGSPKHDVKMGVGNGIEHVRDERNGRHIGRGRLRADPEGQLYVPDSEAEDSDLEQSCRPVLRQRMCMELWLAGIEEANREVFIPWIKDVFLFTALLRKIQIKGMANITNWCIIKDARKQRRERKRTTGISQNCSLKEEGRWLVEIRLLISLVIWSCIQVKGHGE